MKAILGIDNGISGGLCLLSADSPTPPIAKIVMPIQKTKRGNEVDAAAIKQWLFSSGLFIPAKFIRVVIEEPGGSKSAKAAASMAASFGALRAIFQWEGMTVLRITPQSWQKEMIGKCADTKAAALTKARELWPDEDWLENERCRVPHTGLLDAALIGEFARRMKL